MTYGQLRDLAGAIESVVKVAALGIGGYWAYSRFVRQREKYAFIEFTVNLLFIGKQEGWWIVEVIADIQNKGKVQHRISNFNFDLAAIFQEDKMETSEEYGGQVFFPHQVAKGSWLPAKFNHFFIDPGTKAHYSYIARIPEAASFAILHGWFDYTDQKASHTAEKSGKDRANTVRPNEGLAWVIPSVLTQTLQIPFTKRPSVRGKSSAPRATFWFLVVGVSPRCQ